MEIFRGRFLVQRLLLIFGYFVTLSLSFRFVSDGFKSVLPIFYTEEHEIQTLTLFLAKKKKKEKKEKKKKRRTLKAKIVAKLKIYPFLTFFSKQPCKHVESHKISLYPFPFVPHCYLFLWNFRDARMIMFRKNESH